MNSHHVEYLLIGGYAVGYYGYVRATADIDVWVRQSRENAQRIVSALKRFGFDVPNLSPDLFVTKNKIVRMGVPPMRIEIITAISGVEFDECYARRVVDQLHGIEVSIIDLQDLKINKKASGRTNDLADLEQLP